jgi:CO/xanthine dehydrogenase Mo-binding subunit
MAAHAAVSRAVAHALKADVKSYPLSPDRMKGLVCR